VGYRSPNQLDGECVAIGSLNQGLWITHDTVCTKLLHRRKRAGVEAAAAVAPGGLTPHCGVRRHPTNNPFRPITAARELEDSQEKMLAHRSQRQICSRRVPPNWSPRDWFEEIEAEIRAAALEAERDFEPARGVPLEAFIQHRAWARALRRYRRECNYARRFGIYMHAEDCHAPAAERASFVEISESVLNCLGRLPEPEQRFVQSLFWEEKTEVEVAIMLCLTQSGISRRKRRIPNKLRRWMDQSEKEKKREFAKD
jgi:RNA polymerase sigma factor (sigma-70 family)